MNQSEREESGYDAFKKMEEMEGEKRYVRAESKEINTVEKKTETHLFTY